MVWIRKNVLLFVAVAIVCFCASCQKEVSIAEENTKTLGSSAADFLTAGRYTSLVVELAYMPGTVPDATIIQHLTALLRTHLHKPGGISVRLQAIADVKPQLAVADLIALEKKMRSVFTVASTLAVYVLLANATYTENNNVLALSYWNSSICLFVNAIQAGMPALPTQNNLLVTTLLEHEFGHLLGLVNQGSPANSLHEDSANSNHCNNPQCLMYYGFDKMAFLNPTMSVPRFDAACLADLQANGGK